MQTRFREVCEAVFKFKDHKDKLVHKTVISLLPRMAEFNPELFARNYRSTCMNHLLNALRKDHERGTAFVAVGEVARAIGQEINPYLEAIVMTISMGLTPRRNQVGFEEPLACLSMLVGAVENALSPYLNELLRTLLSVSQSLTNCSPDVWSWVEPHAHQGTD